MGETGDYGTVVNVLLRAGSGGAEFRAGMTTRLLPALEREIDEARLRADHRAALEMLKGSEDRFRALAANLPGMAFQLAREADGRLHFIYVSEGGHSLLGLQPRELVGSANAYANIGNNFLQAAMLAKALG